MSTLEQVVKKNRTVIRPFEKGDMGLLYAEYAADEFLDGSMSPAEFLDYLKEMLLTHNTHWIFEDSGKPIAFMCVKTNGWIVEPHVETFKSASKAAVLRGYMTFLKEFAEKDSRGVCLLKTLDDTRHVFERLCTHGMVSFVGEIPNGDPRGSVFLYCTKSHVRSN